ncbi:activator-dependent family glycosyltransferase [Actinomadura sp. DC4]|uniref:activator-dependent family glycosyltransferase n=1 Tax=Actinomadura sp. DC4 TaxID=3055069 RepID=UPI0025B0E2C9|nr:activator-dependent family glycosyltransferase [Actinomadura sp. DC4]MDN3355686.1 activator-dependent family glycosyltransferase [Actinomadura sp. DC4]
MRVLFTSFPGNTHFFNSVALAWALCAAGHEVRVASGPELVDTITRTGLTAVPVGSAETIKEKTQRAMEERDHGSIEQWLKQAGSPQSPLAKTQAPLSGWENLSRLYDVAIVPGASVMNDSMIDDLVAFSRWWRPDLVLWDAASYAGSIAAAATGAAHGRVLYSHDTDATMRAEFVRLRDLQPPGDRRDPLREWVTGWTEKYELEFSEDLFNGHFTIDQLPPSFRVDTALHYLFMRYVPYNGPAVMPEWLWSTPAVPRVLMTFGLSGRDWSHQQVMSIERIQKTLDAMADLDIELVVTLQDELRDQLSRIPGNTRVVNFVPLQCIVPSCSVVIHQGSPGGFNISLLHGVPQLVISIAPDAHLKSEHLDEFQAGLAIPPAEVTAAKIRDGVVRLLEDPAFQAGAQRVRQEILGQPSPGELVPELERLAARYRR